MFSKITTCDKRYLPSKSPLAISREMYDWTLEEGYTAPPSWCTRKKARLLQNNTRSRLVLLAQHFPTFTPSFETPDEDLCEDVIKTIETIFDVYVKTPIDEIKRVPKKIFPMLDHSLDELMSLSLADFEYLEGRLPKPVFGAIVNYLKNPEVINKYEDLGGSIWYGIEWNKRFARFFDKI
jgi:hypothetical protein